MGAERNLVKSVQNLTSPKPSKTKHIPHKPLSRGAEALTLHMQSVSSSDDVLAQPALLGQRELVPQAFSTRVEQLQQHWGVEGWRGGGCTEIGSIQE